MQYDPKKNEEKIESGEGKASIDPLEKNESAAAEQDKSDEDGYVVVESGLGIDE